VWFFFVFFVGWLGFLVGFWLFGCFCVSLGVGGVCLVWWVGVLFFGVLGFFDAGGLVVDFGLIFRKA